jgi:hypothetical protein
MMIHHCDMRRRSLAVWREMLTIEIAMMVAASTSP